MQALILTGGQGTRLRPFTCGTPKPLLPVINRPFLAYQFDILRRHGVRAVTLAIGYRPQDFRRVLGDGRRYGIRLRYVSERVPLGTGGAVRNACASLRGPLLVLNGDVLNTLDVGAFLRLHRSRRADASIALVRVKDPTLYGLVETDRDGRITRFLEKPSWDEITCNTINAGAYLFEPDVTLLIPPGVPYSLERGLFPQLLEAGRRLYGYVTGGYWMDIGTVEKYLQVHLDILTGRAPFRPVGGGARRRDGFLPGPGARLARSAGHEGDGAALLGRGTSVGPFVRFSGGVCVGADCVIGQGAVLEECVVLDGTRVGDGARLTRCVVGRDCRLGAHASVGPGGAVADGSRLGSFSRL